MPEAVVRARTLGRVRSEALNFDEALLRYLQSADIVKVRNERLRLEESDNDLYRTAFAWVKQEVSRFYETKVTIRGIDFGIIKKTISEALNIDETIVRRLELVPDAIIAILDEHFYIRDIGNQYVRGRQRVKDYQLRAIESVPYYVGKYAVVSETLNLAETAVGIVITVAAELVKVISDSLSFVESAIRTRDRVRTKTETLNLLELRKAALPAALVQLVGDFVVKPLYSGVFSFNKDVNR